jgi:hypothetical protein
MKQSLRWLNGWRRLGVVVVGWWLIVAAALLWRAPERVLQHLPQLGVQQMGAYPVPAPELKEDLEAAKARKLGRELMPWEMEWNPVRYVPIQVGTILPEWTRWATLLGTPVIGWIFIEALAVVGLWVIAGFRPGNLLRKGLRKRIEHFE